jgi:hypothetical protein
MVFAFRAGGARQCGDIFAIPLYMPVSGSRFKIISQLRGSSRLATRDFPYYTLPRWDVMENGWFVPRGARAG